MDARARGSGMDNRKSWRRSDWRRAGFTLIELLVAVAIVAVLAMIATTGYTAIIERQRVATATAEINELALRIERFYSRSFEYPDSLGDVGAGAMTDPWGNAYHYTLLAGTKGKGSARKDRRLNPLNPDFDLFSAGKDGVFKSQISQKDSLDDVIRARGGGYIGLAADY